VRHACLIAITLALTTARAVAHVAPSVDDNNRYLKITPLGDRFRIAYTVFFGEVPGATERQAIDSNHDGTISEAEGHVFGVALAGKVKAALEVALDGEVGPIRWSSIEVGMGTSQVAAGSFSVDLVAYACFKRPRGHHRIVVHDRFAIPRPGETEARVEDSPGITIEHARVGALDDPAHDFRFAGADGPLADDGFDVAIEAGDRAVVVPDADCPAAVVERRGSPVVPLSLAAAVALAAASWFFVRRRRKRAS
jgi:hypothetical protein